jgi:hypothetical protein
MSPVSHSDGCDPGWVGDQPAPSGTGSVDSGVVVFKDGVRGPVLAEVFQTFSTGLSSGARDGRKIGAVFLGTSSLSVVCHPALSSSRTAGPSRATDLAELREALR